MRMNSIALAAALAVSTTGALACDLNAPLPSSTRALQIERAELQLRLAQIDQSLADGNGSSAPRQPPAHLAAPAAPRQLPPGCFVGPRGGTYTITKSGRKNYSGC